MSNETATFCDDCVPRDVSENLVATLRGKCDRCGRDIGSLIGVSSHDVDAKYLWPRPIPVSQSLPELGETVLAYYVGGDGGDGLALEGWVAATCDSRSTKPGDNYLRPLNEFIECSTATITHWVPLPPKP